MSTPWPAGWLSSHLTVISDHQAKYGSRRLGDFTIQCCQPGLFIIQPQRPKSTLIRELWAQIKRDRQRALWHWWAKALGLQALCHQVLHRDVVGIILAYGRSPRSGTFWIKI